jgi:hypothetical protein
VTLLLPTIVRKLARLISLLLPSVTHDAAAAAAACQPQEAGQLDGLVADRYASWKAKGGLGQKIINGKVRQLGSSARQACSAGKYLLRATPSEGVCTLQTSSAGSVRFVCACA